MLPIALWSKYDKVARIMAVESRGGTGICPTNSEWPLFMDFFWPTLFFGISQKCDICPPKFSYDLFLVIYTKLSLRFYFYTFLSLSGPLPLEIFTFCPPKCYIYLLKTHLHVTFRNFLHLALPCPSRTSGLQGKTPTWPSSSLAMTRSGGQRQKDNARPW